MLLDVRNKIGERLRLRSGLWIAGTCVVLAASMNVKFSRVLAKGSTGSQQTATQQTSSSQSTPVAGASGQTSGTPGPATNTPQLTQQRAALNIVVLDPAHGGTDTGARGTGGIHESEIVMDMAQQVRRALELKGFQVVQTRQGNENPSFNDRSAIANAQSGAVFVTLHVSSTGLPGSARVYVNSDLPQGTDATGLIPWDRAQGPFQTLSRKLGDTIQGNLAQRFKGSPPVAQIASIRQLRTTAAPAIAVEISSVSVDDRTELDQMIPGVADAIARGVAEFKPSFVVATGPGGQP